MKIIRTLIVSLGIFQSVFGQEAGGADDFKSGLAGLKQASQDPRLLAQLMQDLQVRPLDHFLLRCGISFDLF